MFVANSYVTVTYGLLPVKSRPELPKITALRTLLDKIVKLITYWNSQTDISGEGEPGKPRAMWTVASMFRMNWHSPKCLRLPPAGNPQ